MKVAVIGASGQAGSSIVAELASRGHQILAIARHPEKIEARSGVTTSRGDVQDKAGLAALLKGQDAVVSSVHFRDTDPQKLIDAVRASGVKRYFIVGGAGSLEVAPGVRLIDTPQFPDAYKAEASKGGEFLALLKTRQRSRLDLPVPVGNVRRRRTDGKIPARQGPTAHQREGQQHLLRGFRDRRRRRTREAGAYQTEVHDRVLKQSCCALAALAELIGVGKAFASPPSEPYVRFSRIRLSSWWFPHRECLASAKASRRVKRPLSAKKALGQR